MENKCAYKDCEERGYYGNEYGTYCEEHFKLVKGYYQKRRMKNGSKS